MLRLIVQRVLVAIPTLLVVSIVVFLVGSLTGESYYARKKADPTADLAQIRQEEREERLDRPLPVQYGAWLARLCFDLYLGHPEHVIEDLERSTPGELGWRVEGGRIDPVTREAAWGRSSMRVRADGEEPAVRLVIDDLAGFLERGWRRGAAAAKDPRVRHARPAEASGPLDPEVFESLAFSLLADRGPQGAVVPTRVTVRLRRGDAELVHREMRLDPAGRWDDVRLPVEVCAGSAAAAPDAPPLSLEILADRGFSIDWFRVRERRLRFDWGAPNFGRSGKYGREALSVLTPFMINTILLGAFSLLITWAVAIPLGTYCGVHRGGVLDRVFSLLAFVAMSVPNFFLALVALFLGGILANDLAEAWLGFALFPTTGAGGGLAAGWWPSMLDRLHHLVLPVLVISAGTVAGLQRIARGNLVDVLRAGYIKMARAKGLSEHRVIYKHALRNAINPLITIFGYQLSALLSGSALVEIVFSYPGLGRMTLDAIRDQDRNVVMAAVMVSGCLLVAANLLADLLLGLADPRIRLPAEAASGGRR